MKKLLVSLFLGLLTASQADATLVKDEKGIIYQVTPGGRLIAVRCGGSASFENFKAIGPDLLLCKDTDNNYFEYQVVDDNGKATSIQLPVKVNTLTPAYK